jgi:hypothetical protein
VDDGFIAESSPLVVVLGNESTTAILAASHSLSSTIIPGDGGESSTLMHEWNTLEASSSSIMMLLGFVATKLFAITNLPTMLLPPDAGG